MYKIYFADNPPRGTKTARGDEAYSWRDEKAEGSNLRSLIPDRGRLRVVKSPPAPIPVDPAGPDRYRGRDKPWESYTPG
ncbi:hypothetical protein ATY89_11490 [Sulfolobus acidocaldarius]|uniref:Uncharacterized protein n=1 Tax=Sulfolobus acidocaldarius TaxID=2285 RepID=A0A0U2Y4K1_9CREN|nr:hypothetical protein ATY89_11490 [Sulfolobus acidocaldarius]